MILPHGALSLSSLEEQSLQPGIKGLPISAPLRQGAIGVQGWNVLRGDTGFPVGVLKLRALEHNLAWMHDFCARHGVLLAPHGKTTMCPHLFGAQLAHGAWGISHPCATFDRWPLLLAVDDDYLVRGACNTFF
jgi:D-serine dehydratase